MGSFSFVWVIVLRSTSKLKQVSIGVVNPIGCWQFHRSLSLSFFDLPLLNVELNISWGFVTASPDFDIQQVVRYWMDVDFLEIFVDRDDRISRVYGNSQTFRVAANVSVQEENVLPITENFGCSWTKQLSSPPE